MKRFLAVAAILLVTSAHATELSFGDINYFYKQNQFNIGADATTSSYLYQESGTNIEKEGYTALAHANYGILDDLYLSLDFNYQWRMKIKGDGGTYHEDGLSSPRLGLNYRLLKQDMSGFNLDIGAFYTSKNLQEKSQKGGNDQDGNNIASRNAAELNLRAGNKWNEANEFYLLAGIKHNFDGEYNDETPGVGNGGTYAQDASTDYYFGAFYQYRPVHEFMMNAMATAYKYSEIDGKRPDSTKFTTDSHTDMRLRFQAKFLITESLIANFSYAQRYLPDYDDGSESLKIKRRHEHSIGLGVDLLF